MKAESERRLCRRIITYNSSVQGCVSPGATFSKDVDISSVSVGIMEERLCWPVGYACTDKTLHCRPINVLCEAQATSSVLCMKLSQWEIMRYYLTRIFILLIVSILSLH